MHGDQRVDAGRRVGRSALEKTSWGLALAALLSPLSIGSIGSIGSMGARGASAAAGGGGGPARAVVNAPVAPDAIYVARGGARAGLSVIDLNGFGQSTGNPDFDLVFGPGSQGKSRFPFNPNLFLQGAVLLPPLVPGRTAADGGSAGVFTLTLDSQLDELLAQGPSLASLGDLMLGQPLDLAFNNGLPPGCASGGGSLCSHDGLQVLAVSVAGPNTLAPTPPGARPDHVVFSGGNPISFAPHPNPPGRLAIPLCLTPLIAGAEPTSVFSAAAPPDGLGLFNLLAPGANFLGDPALGIPPTNTLAREQNAFFVGPSAPAPTPLACKSFMLRQQIGHFLYALDREREELLVLGSNTFEVLARIGVPQPVELAMDPDLRLLAVTSRGADEVVFVDIDPRSPRFHEIVARTPVGSDPAGIAWEPGNEDVLVCNEGDGTLSILDAGSLRVRKVAGGLERPFALAVTPRQDRFGFERDVYFAYVLERTGRLALFESGPDGPNGWGFDAIVGRTEAAVPDPRAIQPDPLRISSGVWIAHEAGVTEVVLESTRTGQIPLLPGEPPSWRGLSLRALRTLGPRVLSGAPRDLAFDDQRNFGALANYRGRFGHGTPAALNGKQLVRDVPRLGICNPNEPASLVVAVAGGAAGAGAVDVIDLERGTRVDVDVFRPGVQSIAAAGARLVMDYFRQ